MWSNLGIRQKVFILFFVVALLPLIIINVIWIRSSRTQLTSAAINRENIFIDSSAQRVNSLLEAKVNSVISHSQESSVINLDTVSAGLNLQQYSNQESDIVQIILADHNGDERIVVQNHTLGSKLTNIKSSDGFKVVTQLSNEVSVSEVRRENGLPIITIAVPLLSFSKLGAQNLTTAESLARRSGSDVKGALIVDINVSDMFDSILNNKTGGDSYTYIVDSTGKLLAHPSQSFMKSHGDVSEVAQVTKLLDKPNFSIQPSETISETGSRVLSASYPIKRTGWAVVIEEPVKSILAPANNVLRLALTIFVSVALLSSALSLLFSRNITRPISKLVAGTSAASQGDFTTQIHINSTDEIGVLAKRFNNMTTNLGHLITDIRNESTKLNIVLNSVNECVIATDAQNKIVFANIAAAIMAGALPTDLSGKQFSNVFKLFNGKSSFEIDPNSTTVVKDITYISPNERTHYLDVSINKIENDPEGIQTIITLRDLTDERELEAMKLDFVSMAAHELRTPLTAVRGYLSLLSTDRGSTLSTESRQSVDRAEESTKQLVGLINNLLNVSKIERESLNLTYSKIDWAKTIEAVVKDHKFSAEEKGIQISFEDPGESIPLLVDELAIREVLNNLISNAINYSNRNGYIRVGVKVEGNNVITYVKDNGFGMSPEVVEKLFTKFYRAHGPLSSGSGGTGLGLFISKSIVELHKGKIWAESKVDEGSTFTFSLPAFDALQYEQLANKVTGLNKRRGWITKNITS